MKRERESRWAVANFFAHLGVGTAALAAGGPLVSPKRARTPKRNDEKRRARYQPDSPHVQTYYRVNRYPPK